MADRMFWDMNMVVVISTIAALFVSWDAQRQCRQPNLLRRIWTWQGCELTFLAVFTSALGMIVGFYVVKFLSSLLGSTGSIQFIVSLVGGLIGLEVTRQLIGKKLRTQFVQAKRDLKTSLPSPEL